jgi:hypothetical protein
MEGLKNTINKTIAANTDNMGKLFPAFLLKKRDRLSRFLPRKAGLWASG